MYFCLKRLFVCAHSAAPISPAPGETGPVERPLLTCQLRAKLGKLAALNWPGLNWPRSTDPTDIHIALESGVFKFTLNDQLKKKWNTAIAESIPLYDCGEKLLLGMRTRDDYDTQYILNLPNFPKNIEEMIIVRCWLEKIFKCVFRSASFEDYGFNPQMINILFDNDKTIPLQLNVEIAFILPKNNISVNKLEIISDRLVISEFLAISFEKVDIVEEQHNIDILLKILINKGDKIRAVLIDLQHELSGLYDNIVEYIATSRDCSKIVHEIEFRYNIPVKFKLIERAEKVEKEDDIVHKTYQISNIYHPEVKFDLHCRMESEIEFSTYYYTYTIYYHEE
uniref:Uncharacterized protein n=2 Tax=Meloidogyne TaxID=189290 RepID=A0A6V7TRJ8_MELEN|nr:unnamed protein product [Meloidogyne enterolobii]